MGALRFSDDPPRIYVVPRLEDRVIDELFYQEDEIGEMRHAAFMIECGLEEDPPDGPDVAPIPWKGSKYSSSTATPNSRKPPLSPSKSPRRGLQRRRSSDSIQVLEEELSPKRAPPARRRLVATKSGTLHGMRSAPQKSYSVDFSKDAVVGLALAKTEKKGRKLIAAKSGTLHGMREAAKQAVESEKSEEKSPRTPTRSRLVHSKSGTLHGMRAALASPQEKDKSPGATKSTTRSVPTRGAGLTATRSDSKLRKVKKKDKDGEPSKNSSAREKKTTKKTSKKKKVSKKATESDEESESFSDVDKESHGSDVSISSDEGNNLSPGKRPTFQRRGSKGNLDGLQKKKPKEGSDLASKTKSTVASKSSETKDSDSSRTGLGDSKSTSKNVRSAVREFRNGGKSPAELLRSMQSDSKSKPSKSSSVSAVNVPSYLASSPTKSPKSQKARVRVVKTSKPKKTKSAGTLEIPPAFRAAG